MNGVIAHVIPLLSGRGLSAWTAAFAASMLGVLTLFGRLLTGALLDRFSGPYVGGLLFGVAAMGVAYVGQGAPTPEQFDNAYQAGDREIRCHSPLNRADRARSNRLGFDAQTTVRRLTENNEAAP